MLDSTFISIFGRRELAGKAGEDDKVKGGRAGGTCSTNMEKKNSCSILVGKLEGKKPLEDQVVCWRIILRCIS
jgi:hypothetical protein